MRGDSSHRRFFSLPKPCRFLILFFSVCVLYFFFFSSRRRHTRLVSDWSSDVCSSDLTSAPSRASAQAVAAPAGPPPTTTTSASIRSPTLSNRARDALEQSHVLPVRRSEERRVGKECRSGWWSEQ